MILRSVYQRVAERELMLPVVVGRKSASERFAGAVETLSMEALMRDGRALQAGTSHYLGQNFSRAYDVRYTGRDGAEEFPHTTSWGVSTRLVGALIMAHGDDQGLRLPPSIAPYQAVVVPIYRSDEERDLVLGEADRVVRDLRRRRVRVHVDDRDQHRPGYKFNEWELKGVPLRVELGPRDIAAGQATLFWRDLATKEPVRLGELGAVARELLSDIQRGLFEDARRFRDEHTYTPTTWDEMRQLLSSASGFVVAGWCGDEACEARVKEETKATIRVLPLRRERTDGSCLVCGRPASERAHWAQAY